MTKPIADQFDLFVASTTTSRPPSAPPVKAQAPQAMTPRKPASGASRALRIAAPVITKLEALTAAGDDHEAALDEIIGWINRHRSQTQNQGTDNE